MYRPGEVRKGPAQLQFSSVALSRNLRPRMSANKQPIAAAQPAIVTGQLNLSGTQVLSGLLLGVALAGLFVWIFVNHWLFGR